MRPASIVLVILNFKKEGYEVALYHLMMSAAMGHEGSLN